MDGEETGEEGGEETGEDVEGGAGKRVELGSGQTMSWQCGGQNSRILRYCLLSLDSQSGVISGGMSN